MNTMPLRIRRTDAEFTLQRIGDAKLRRLARHASAVESDPAWWLIRGAVAPCRMSLPEFFVALSRAFGASSCIHDSYKSSFCFPFHLTTAKGITHGDYLLLVQDYKGGPDARLWRRDGERRRGFRPYEPFVDAEFSRDDLRHLLTQLDDLLLQQLRAAALPVPDFVKAVESEQMVYGYRNGSPFERCYRHESNYLRALARYQFLPERAEVVPHD